MPTRPEDHTVGWICALEIEYLVACELLDEEYSREESPKINHTKDPNIYTFGRISEHNIVVACLPKGRYGLSSAALVAERIRATFPALRFGLLVGIAGGAPSAQNDIRLGDVVVSVPTPGCGGVLQYDFGKAIQDHEFQATGYLAPPPEVLLNALTHMSMQHRRQGNHIAETIAAMVLKNPRLKDCNPPPAATDRLYTLTYVHSGQTSCDCKRQDEAEPSDIDQILVRRMTRPEHVGFPYVHYGLVASANQLMKDASTRSTLAAKHDVLCFEMEAAGLMNNFPCVAIKGICDYSDTHKNDVWHPFAAAAAAAYTKELLHIIPGNVVSSRETMEPGEEFKNPLQTGGQGIPRNSVLGLPNVVPESDGELYSDADYLHKSSTASNLSLTSASPVQAKWPVDNSSARIFNNHGCLVCNNEASRFSSDNALTVHIRVAHPSLEPVVGILHLSPQESDLSSSGAQVFRKAMLRHLKRHNASPTWKEVVSMINRAARDVGGSQFPEILRPSWVQKWNQICSKHIDSQLKRSDSLKSKHTSIHDASPSTFTETSTEVLEYNDHGNVTKRTISRTSSRSSMQSSQSDQEHTNPLDIPPPLPPFTFPLPRTLPSISAPSSPFPRNRSNSLHKKVSSKSLRSRSASRTLALESHAQTTLAAEVDAGFDELHQFAHDIVSKEKAVNYTLLVMALRRKVQTLLRASERLNKDINT